MNNGSSQHTYTFCTWHGPEWSGGDKDLGAQDFGIRTNLSLRSPFSTGYRLSLYEEVRNVMSPHHYESMSSNLYFNVRGRESVKNLKREQLTQSMDYVEWPDLPAH
ncbi:hypothetical protein SBOR_0102 [Sclerotinia borealis F-4128]|uniref:Uncharacterized protein n=1 Tax=Sclerotinia borealis (strain F-4128) TaxID=1432307 RepID=W9CRV8_SCLBF|nr:hypothetical protein SBOR_0102 [Sclerotinia borealis F-4128]